MACVCEEGFTMRTEGFDHKKRRVFADSKTPTGINVHDCDYISRRNSVLDRAEAEADRNCRGKGMDWHRVFFAAVDRLSMEGL